MGNTPSLQNHPADGCKVTSDRLILDGLKSFDFCPICLEDYDVECRIANHPPAISRQVIDEHGLQIKEARGMKVMYEVKAMIRDSNSYKGYRPTIFKCAQDNQAYYLEDNPDKSFFYENNDLVIDVLFAQREHAGNFQNALSNFSINHPTFGAKISFDHTIYDVDVNICPRRVFYSDYKTEDSDSPPYMTFADLREFELCSSNTESSVAFTANSIQQLKTLENLSWFPNLKCYKCHIISTAVEKYRNDEDNIIYASWTFQQYFDGRNTLSQMPELALKYVSTGATQSREISPGVIRNMTQINVRIIFRDENAVPGIMHQLKYRTERETTKTFISYIFAYDEDKMRYFLKTKYEHTLERWKENPM